MAIFSAKQIQTLPNAKAYTDIQLLKLLKYLSQGYSIHKASWLARQSKQQSDDNIKYLLSMPQLRQTREFYKLFIRPYMIKEQVETLPYVIDFLLTCNPKDILKHHKFIALWLTGSYQVPSNRIKALLRYVNKIYLLSEILRYRSKIDKCDIQKAYGNNISWQYIVTRNQEISKNLKKIAKLVNELNRLHQPA